MKKWEGLLKTFSRTLHTVNRHKPYIRKMNPSERYCYSPTLHWNSQVEEYFVEAYGADHFARISKALARPSCYSCVRVNKLKSTSDAVIEKLLAVLQERRLQDYPAKGGDNVPHKSDDSVTLQVDSAGVSGASVGKYLITKCRIPSLDYVVLVKGSGPHHIDYEYKKEKTPKEVIVSRKCAEAVLRGAHVYVPGVLACSAHVEKGDTVAVSVAVEQPGADGGWGVGFTRGTVLQGSDADPYHFERSGIYIGEGTAMMSRAGLFRASEGVAVDLKNRVFNLPSFHDLLEGEIFLQNLPSIIVAHVLDPQEGEKILDMCAAPGGKTTAIAMLMKDRGEVIAADRSHNKVLDIQKLAAEMDLKCITACKLDALKSVRTVNGSTHIDGQGCVEIKSVQHSDSLASGVEETVATTLGSSYVHKVAAAEKFRIENFTNKTDARKTIRKLKNGTGRSSSMGGRVECSKGFLPNSFDRVLLDAPCSALGLRPRLFAGEDTMDSLRGHATYQRRMLDQAVQLVRPGGVLVYSTCTINPGENEALVRYALDTYAFLSLAPQHPKVGGPGLIGECELSDGRWEEWLRPGEANLVQKFDPSSELDTIGFFIAKFNVNDKDL